MEAGRRRRSSRGVLASSAVGDGAWAILRIPILYGRVTSLAESPINELAAKLLEGDVFKTDDWAMRYPAHADDVARAVAVIAEQLMRSAPPVGGIYHLASGEAFTKYAMAQVIAEELAIDPQRVQPDPNPPSGAPRRKTVAWTPAGSRRWALPPRSASPTAFVKPWRRFAAPARPPRTIDDAPFHRPGSSPRPRGRRRF